MNSFLQSQQPKPAADAAATAPTEPGPNTGSALINPSGVAPGTLVAQTPGGELVAAKPGTLVNPPEGGEDGDAAGARKTSKGKAKAAAAVALDAASIEAIAELVVDKMALRMTRGIQ